MARYVHLNITQSSFCDMSLIIPMIGDLENGHDDTCTCFEPRFGLFENYFENSDSILVLLTNDYLNFLGTLSRCIRHPK